jgi:hypothetical protein
MGEPAIPTEADRQATRKLATAIVDSVRNDTSMAEALGFSRHLTNEKLCRAFVKESE